MKDKKPKLYYQCIDGVAFDNFCSDAAIGARDSGIETIQFEDINLIPYDPYNIVVASVEDTLEYLGKEVNVIDHSWTYPFTRRESKEFKSIDKVIGYPCFIKPSKDIKAFTGFIAENSGQAKQFSLNFEGPVLRQDQINIESEYRVYVSKSRGVIGIKHYLGDPYISLDKIFVEKCWRESQKHLQEQSYTLDFGVDDKGQTLLIEVNDGWAIGNYGLDPKEYYHFVKNRFLQLTGVIR